MPFAPSDISGLKIWLKAATRNYTDLDRYVPAKLQGDVVATVADKMSAAPAGVGYLVYQQTSGNRPTLDLNIASSGFNGLKFDGVHGALFASLTFSTDPLLVLPTARISASIWVKCNGTAGTSDGIIGTPTNSAWSNGFGIYYSSATQIKGWITTFSSHFVAATITPGNWNHIVLIWDGSTITLYVNGSSAGTAAFSGTMTHGNLLHIGELDTSENLNGWLDEITLYDAVLSASDVTNLFNYGHAPDAVVNPTPITTTSTDALLDDYWIYATSGVSRTVNSPAKYASNPVFGTGGTWDLDVNFQNVLKFSDTDYRIWYGGYSYSPASPEAGSSKGYATSTDGLSWTRPNLGLKTWNGNTNNNIIQKGGNSDGLFYNAAGATGQKFLLIDDSSNSSILYGSEDGTTSLTLLKTLTTGSPVSEGGFPLVRADGRFVIMNEVFNPNGNTRNIGMWLSDTTDPTGLWTYQGVKLPINFLATVHRYHMGVSKFGPYWLAIVEAFDNTAKTSDLDLFVSRDEGMTWYQSKATFISKGSVGAWDSKRLLYGQFVHSGTKWRIYYTGWNVPEDGTTPDNGRLGFSDIDYLRVGQFNGTGSFTTSEINLPNGSLTINANATGGTITAALFDSGGSAIAGYGDAQSTSVSTDTTSSTITWSGNNLPNQDCRVRFTLTSATLYAWTVTASTGGIFPYYTSAGMTGRMLSMAGGMQAL